MARLAAPPQDRSYTHALVQRRLVSDTVSAQALQARWGLFQSLSAENIRTSTLTADRAVVDTLTVGDLVVPTLTVTDVLTTGTVQATQATVTDAVEAADVRVATTLTVAGAAVTIPAWIPLYALAATLTGTVAPGFSALSFTPDSTPPQASWTLVLPSAVDTGLFFTALANDGTGDATLTLTDNGVVVDTTSGIDTGSVQSLFLGTFTSRSPLPDVIVLSCNLHSAATVTIGEPLISQSL